MMILEKAISVQFFPVAQMAHAAGLIAPPPNPMGGQHPFFSRVELFKQLYESKQYGGNNPLSVSEA